MPMPLGATERTILTPAAPGRSSSKPPMATAPTATKIMETATPLTTPSSPPTLLCRRHRRHRHQAPGQRDRPQHPLLNPQPSFTATRAAPWSPDLPRSTPADFAPPLTELLQVAAALRATETYRFDLVDVSRQAMANE